MGHEIEFIQQHRTEKDLSVVAGSILVRDEFVKGLVKLEKQFEVKLPKGASSTVDAAAKKMWTNAAQAELARVAGVPVQLFK